MLGIITCSVVLMTFYDIAKIGSLIG